MLSKSTLIEKILKTETFHTISKDDILAKQQFSLFRIFSITGALVATGVFFKMAIMFSTLNFTSYLLLLLSFTMLINFYQTKIETVNRSYYLVLISSFLLLHIIGYSTD